MARRALAVAALALLWVALWGDLSWANLVGGALVALVVLSVGGPGRDGPIRRPGWGAVARYAAEFARDLVVATWDVARQVFWPVSRLRPAVVAVPLRSDDPGLLALVADSITLTPGTLTVEADDVSSTLWVHLLHLPEGGVDAVVAQVQHLEDVGARALGVALPEPGRTGGRRR